MTNPRSETIISYLFFMILGITLAVYLLRGLQLLAFLPGGVILILIILALGTGILYGIEKTRRF